MREPFVKRIGQSGLRHQRGRPREVLVMGLEFPASGLNVLVRIVVFPWVGRLDRRRPGFREL